MKKLLTGLALFTFITISFAKPIYAQLPSEVITLSQQDSYITWYGNIEPVIETKIAAQINAEITDLPLDIGDTFSTGDILAKLDDTDQQANLDYAQSQLATAKTEFDIAQADWQRAQILYKNNAYSKVQLESATTRLANAKAALQTSKAELSKAENQLQHSIIKAPFDGVVLKRNVNIGQAIQSGPPEPQTIMTIAALDQLRLSVSVPESQLDMIRKTNKAIIKLAENNEYVTDQLDIFPYIETQNQTVQIRINLPTATANTLIGKTIPVSFITTKSNELLIPNQAIVRRGEITGVYLIDPTNQTIKLRYIRLGKSYKDKTAVIAGLTTGEEIITDPDAAYKFLNRHE